jgi:hypothetical protein
VGGRVRRCAGAGGARLGGAQRSGQPGGEHQLRVPAERSTDGGQTPGFVTGGRGALSTASWTNQGNATLTNTPIFVTLPPSGRCGRPIPPSAPRRRRTRRPGRGQLPARQPQKRRDVHSSCSSRRPRRPPRPRPWSPPPCRATSEPATRTSRTPTVSRRRPDRSRSWPAPRGGRCVQPGRGRSARRGARGERDQPAGHRGQPDRADRPGMHAGDAGRAAPDKPDRRLRCRPTRTPGGSNGRPARSYSSRNQPAPMPSSKRLPDSRSSVAASLASTTGCR